MQERAACVLIIGVQPALFELADALEEFDLEVVRSTKLEEISWLLRIWSGACVAVLDAGLPGSDTFAAIHHRLHLAPSVPTLIVFDEDLALAARDLAGRDSF